jgi:aspartate ammonia-lyase
MAGPTKLAKRTPLGLPVSAWIPLGAQTRNCLDFHSFSQNSLGNCPRLVRALLDVKEAAARTNFAVNQITAEELQSILDAIQHTRLNSLEWSVDFPVDIWQGGGAIAINLNINERLAVKIDVEHWQSWVQVINRSQSTADVCASAVRLACREAILDLQQELKTLHETLLDKQREFDTIPGLSRTCLRDALPTSLGNKLRGYVESVDQAMCELAAVHSDLAKLNLGGTVIGSSTGAKSEYVAQVVTQLAVVRGESLSTRADLYAAAQNSDDLGRGLLTMELLATRLIRMCADLRLLGSGPKSGFNELEFQSYMNGSSFFADKINPTQIETLMQACFLVLGRVRTGMLAVERAELDLNVFDSCAGLCLLESFEMLASSVNQVAHHSLRGMGANVERCREMVSFQHPGKK